MSVEDLQAMTGLTAEEAAQYFEMAGGDLEGAVNLFFGLGAAGGDDSSGAQSAQSGSGKDWPSFMNLVTGHGQDPNEAWVEQDIRGSDHDGELAGLVQYKNGPCGALAVVNAVLIAQRLANGSAIHEPFAKDEVAHAIASIVKKCAAKGATNAVLCSWKSDRHSGGVSMDDVPLDLVESAILDSYEMFTGRGSLLLLVFSCIATHDPDAVKQEMVAGGGEPPLIVGPNLLCSSELLRLLLSGCANGNIGAFSPMGGKNPSLKTVGGVGLLSLSELESGIPVADELKSPEVPVWILHSGDHFTIMYKDKTGNTKAKPPQELFLFNGLPPAGPRCCKVIVEGKAVADDAPSEKKDSYVKPVAGEIEDIVQADPKDKSDKPDDWTSWKYEVILAIDDPTIQGPERSKDYPSPVIFKLGKPDISSEWRCASCYRTRFQTMCFGQNPAGTEFCQNCGKNREEAGWSLWIPFKDLPRDWQRKMNRRHAPKVVSLLQTKWPDCTVTLLDSSRDSTTLPSV